MLQASVVEGEKVRAALQKERELCANLEGMATQLSNTLDSLEKDLTKERKARELLKQRIVAAATELAKREGKPATPNNVYGVVPPEFKAQYGRVEDEFSDVVEEDTYAKLPPPMSIYGEAPPPQAEESAGAAATESHYGSITPALKKVLANAKTNSAATPPPVVESQYDRIPKELGGKDAPLLSLAQSTAALDDVSGGAGGDEEVDLANVPELAAHFYPNCNREIADQILKSKPADTFLLRDSSRKRSFAISFVDEDKNIKHNLISFVGNGYRLEGEQDLYNTVSQLLFAYGFKT